MRFESIQPLIQRLRSSGRDGVQIAEAMSKLESANRAAIDTINQMSRQVSVMGREITRLYGAIEQVGGGSGLPNQSPWLGPIPFSATLVDYIRDVNGNLVAELEGSFTTAPGVDLRYDLWVAETENEPNAIDFIPTDIAVGSTGFFRFYSDIPEEPRMIWYALVPTPVVRLKDTTPEEMGIHLSKFGVSFPAVAKSGHVSSLQVFLDTRDLTTIKQGRFRATFTAPNDPNYDYVAFYKRRVNQDGSPIGGEEYEQMEFMAARQSPVLQTTWWKLPDTQEYWRVKAVPYNDIGEPNDDSPPSVVVTVPAHGAVKAQTVDESFFGPGFQVYQNQLLIKYGAEFEVNGNGDFVIKNVDLSKALNYNNEFEVAGGQLRIKTVNLSKAAGFSPSEFELSGGAFVVKELSATKMKLGVLSVGGPGMVSKMAVFDTVGNGIGWIGDDSMSSGYIGAWFKRLLVGGMGPASAGMFTDVNGNVIARSIQIYDTSGTYGWIGSSGAWTGAWFKRILIGGSSPGDAKIIADSNGNVLIPGSLITGELTAATIAANKITGGTISASVTMTSPSLQITGSGFVCSINSVDSIKVHNQQNDDYVVVNKSGLNISRIVAGSNRESIFSSSGFSVLSTSTSWAFGSRVMLIVVGKAIEFAFYDIDEYSVSYELLSIRRDSYGPLQIRSLFPGTSISFASTNSWCLFDKYRFQGYTDEVLALSGLSTVRTIPVFGPTGSPIGKIPVIP